MRIATSILLLVCLTFVPLPIAVGLLLGYALLWPGLELLVIAVLIDSFFGLSAPYPIYTVLAGGALIIVTWLKPYLSVYTT